MIRKLLAAAVVVAVSGFALAADPKSGPQAGEKVPGPFHPLNINGEYAGKKSCLYCNAGDSPVVAVFARSADDATLKKLIGVLETEAVKNEKAELNAFVVFCSDDEKLADKLKEHADKAKFKKVILAVEESAGPEKYNISKDADVTVVVYKERLVTSNYTFGKGKLTEKDIEKITADIAKIVK